MNLSNKTALVFDYGDFIHIAERLGRDFGTVYYYTPYQASFPTYNNQVIGVGVPGIERVYEFWPYVEEADVIVFPDLFQADLQMYLRSIGKAVFGAGYGEELEIYRPESKEVLKSVGLPVGPYDIAYGLDELTEKLKNVEDRYIKMNGYLRGQMETWHHENYDLSKPVLEQMAHTFGPARDREPFIIEEPIKSMAEVGVDTFCIDGEFPNEGLVGVENKDCCYIGAFVKRKDMLKQMKECNDKLSPILKNYEYRGLYSNEVRIGKEDEKGYLVDACCRAGSPPSEVMTEAYDNFSEMVWNVAHGVVPEPKYSNKYAVECIITSDWATAELQAIYFPPEIAKFVKIKNRCVIDGVTYFVPQKNDMTEIGALVFCSNSLEDAIVEMEYMAKQVKGYCVDIDTDALKETAKLIKDNEQKGLKILG